MASFCTFKEFDGRLNHILGKLDLVEKYEVVEELAAEAEEDVLQELRERVFTLAKAMYENTLKDTDTIGDNDEVEITLQRRNTNGDNTTLSKDIVDLYEYTVGYNVSCRSCSFFPVFLFCAYQHLSGYIAA